MNFFLTFMADSFQRYCHDEDIPAETFSARNNGGSSIKVYSAFSYRETLELQVVQGRQNATGYIGMLE